MRPGVRVELRTICEHALEVEDAGLDVGWQAEQRRSEGDRGKPRDLRGARRAGEAPELGGSGLALEPQSLAARPDFLTFQGRRRGGDCNVRRVERDLPL